MATAYTKLKINLEKGVFEGSYKPEKVKQYNVNSLTGKVEQVELGPLVSKDDYEKLVKRKENDEKHIHNKYNKIIKELTEAEDNNKDTIQCLVMSGGNMLNIDGNLRPGKLTDFFKVLAAACHEFKQRSDT